MAQLNISLRHLEVFCAVVEQETLNDAAHVLLVSPSGVSLALTELEKRLGTQLTVRIRGKGVAITPAGREVYALAKRAIDTVGAIDAVAAATRGTLGGPLRVGVFTTLSPWVIPAIAEHFTTRYPDVDLEFVEGTSAELQRSLLDGDLDAAIVYLNHVTGDVDATKIVPVQLMLAISSEHPLAKTDTVELASLQDEDAIIFGVRPVSDHVEGILREAGLPISPKWRSSNIETVRSLVARGLGYAVIMGRPFGDHSYEGRSIAYLEIADALPENALVLATARGTRRTEKVAALLQFCREEFRDLWQ